MSPEKQRIAIAEACGWRDIYHDPVNNTYCGLPPHGYFKAGEMMCHPDLPDYLNDLNAMHEAENVLFAINDWRSIRAYFSHLSPNLHGEDALDGDDWKLCHATAAQRAEAFLRTIGRWEEGGAP